MRSHVGRTIGATLALTGLLALPACDRDSDDDHEDDFASLEVIDRGDPAQPVVAVWTAAAGWDGALPEISLASANQRISIGFRAYAEDGDEFTLSETGEYSIRYAVAAGAPAGIVDMDHDDPVLFHGDHVHVYGAAEGTTQIQFLFWHVDHADASTTPIAVNVVP